MAEIPQHLWIRMAENSTPPNDRLRVLVVDDNRDCADTIVVLLRHLGHEGHASYDADSGLAAALSLLPHLVLLDLEMPAKDGFSLLRELREGAGFAKAPIVALTGFGDNSHRTQASVAGFDGYLVKPCGLEQLQSVLRIVKPRADDAAS
jgi:DNA-binding response OmpR family regulator